MSFAAGMSAGFAAGFGAGIASGAATGRKQAAEALRKHIEQNNISFRTKAGDELPLEELLKIVTTPEPCTVSRKWLWLILGLGITCLAGVVGYFLLVAR